MLSSSSSAATTVISQNQLNNLNELVSSLKKETLLLRDEVRVKDQMIVTTANMLHRANEELMQLRSAHKVQKEVDENSGELATKVQQLENKVAEKDKMMADWKAKVKEAIKENKRKEKVAEDEIFNLRNQMKDLQSQCRELQYLKKTRDVEKTDQEVQTVGNFLFSGGGGSTAGAGAGGQQSNYVDVEQRLGAAGTAELQYWMKQAEKSTDEASSQQQRGGSGPNNMNNSIMRPLTVILTPPSKLTLRNRSTSAAGTAEGGQENQNQTNNQLSSPQLASPLGTTLLNSTMGFSNSNNNNNILLHSPPPQVPEMSQTELKNAPPIIVSVFYGTADGWSVDTKLRVEAGQTVGDLIVITCQKINARYEKQLDADTMCLRTHHSRAQRWVTMTDSRSVHSFAFFLRSANQNEPIKLQLEPMSAVEMAKRKFSQSVSMYRESVSRQLEQE